MKIIFPLLLGILSTFATTTVAIAQSIDGKSFAKVLNGETHEHRDVIYATHKSDNEKNVYPIRSVRVGKWKYIRNLHPEFAYTTHTDV